MKSNRLKQIIDECVRQALNEGGYWDKTATPLVTNGTTGGFKGHSPGLDKGPELEPSKIDPNGEKFVSEEHIVVSDNKFSIYKIKNFGSLDIKDTMQFFGNTVELRRAIDTVNGAAKRNGKTILYRTITSEQNRAKSERSQYMSNTFWEFSFDGNEWYILKPQPVQSLKISKFVKPA